MKLTFEATPQVGILGAKIIFPDQTIYHAGLTLALKPRRTEFWRGLDLIISFPRLQGYPSTYPIKPSPTSTLLIDRGFLMTTKKVFDLVGGFPKTYSTPTYVVSHFNLMVKNISLSVEYLDEVIGIFHGNIMEFEKKLLQNDATEFDKSWAKQYRHEIDSTLQLTNITLYWNTPCSEKKLGDTIQMIDFILALYGKVPIVLEVENEEECINVIKQIGVPIATVNILASIMNIQSRVGPDRVLVLFNKPIPSWNGRLFGSTSWDSDESRNSAWTSKSFDYVIGFTSTPKTMIPSLIVQQANKVSFQEIWVPSKFAYDALANSGVNTTKLRKVPIPFNNHFFNPTRTIPLYSRSADSFTFLSVFPWTNQFDWRSLLRAFFHEFSGSTSPVVKLMILSRLSDEDIKQFKKFHMELTTEYAAKGALPTIQFISPHFPYAKLASLYASAQAFIRIAHGEQWGMPFIEALAMNIPCIGIDWGSTKEFLNTNNSYLLKNTTLIDVPGGGSWVTINPIELASIMRTVINRHFNSSSFWSSSSPIISRYSIESVSHAVLSRLMEVQTLIPAVKAHKQANPNLYSPPSPPPYTPSWSSGSYNPSYSSYTPSFSQSSQKSDFVNGMKRIKIND